jgi:uncharacterized surface anchored protein
LKKRFLAIVTILLMIFSFMSPVAKASAGELENPLLIGGNDKKDNTEFTNIVNLSVWTQYKIEENFESKIYTVGPLKIRVTFSGNDGGQPTSVSWSYVEGNSAYVGFVFVKGGNSGDAKELDGKSYLYSYDGNGDAFEGLHAPGNSISHVSFYYKQAYSIKVLKVDKSNGSIIKTGAEFTLTEDGNAAFSKNGITGTDGYAVFSDLEAGTYHVKETKAPSGYDLSAEIKDITLPKDDGNAEITFEDTQTPPPPPPKTYSIKVLKVDKSDGSKKLSGAEFTLTKDGDAAFSKPETTGPDGYAVFSDLEAGTYHVKETKAPSGYDLSTEIKDVTLPNNGGDAEITFDDTQTPPMTYSIKVLKVDKSDGSKKLSGAEFTLTKDGDAAFSKPEITGTDGYAVFSDLEAGTYHVKETKAPGGYVLSTEVKDVTLPDNGGNAEITFEDTQTPPPTTYSIKVLKVDNNDNSKKLTGAEFTLTKEGDAAFSKIGITGTDGYAVFSDLEAGTYHVKETKAPGGYVLSTEIKDVTLPDNGGNAEITFEDTQTPPPPPPTTYSIKVLKVDNNDNSKKLTGAEFTLTKEGNAAFSKIGITGTDGYAVFSDLEAGTYHVKETKAPNGYDLSTEIKDITLPDNGGNAEITFEDTQTPPPPPPTTYSIKVLKVDKSDGSKKLSGAEFILTKEGDPDFSKTGITGTDGYAVFSNLEAGTYHVKETKAPSGYVLSTVTKNVTLPNNDGDAEITFEDVHETPPPPPPTTYSMKVLKVDKSDVSKKLSGAEFTLTKDGDTAFSKTGTTGTDGYAVFSNLEAGIYHLRETKAPSGYDLSTETKNVTLPNNDGNAEITFEDGHETPPPPPPPTYNIKAIKVDDSDNSKLQGAEFTLTKQNSTSFKQTGITGLDGTVTFNNLLAGTYYVEETKAPEGYEISKKVETIVLPSGNGDVTVTFNDKKQIEEKYSIKIFKVDTSDKNKKLVGAEFTLTKDGDQSFKQTGITGADGSVVFDDLTAGTYNVQETKAPDGYEISTLTQTLTLPSENKNAEITFYDDPSEVIPEEPIPGSEPEIPVTDEPVPGAEPVLPKTGELPPELFYGLGAAFILAGIFMKKHK